MRLGEICDELRRAGLLARAPEGLPPDRAPRAIADDSRLVRPGDLFVAVRGTSSDGHRFLGDAARAGALAAVAERAGGAGGLPIIPVRSGRRALAVLAAAWHGRPADRLRLVGVTGTNGKTTTAALLAGILSRADGAPAGFIGTTERRIGGRGAPAATTTPGPLELHALLAGVLEAGGRSAAVEVSSHAIAQGRCAGVPFRAGVLTNVARDHLDYHGSFRAYRRVKAAFFAGLPPGAIAVLNRDDPSSTAIARRARDARILWYGLKEPPADMEVREARATPQGVALALADAAGAARLRARTPGRHNLENLFAAARCARGLGIPWAAIEEAVAGFRAPPGRLEEIETGGPFRVFVDYAHTEDALRRVLESAREFTRGRLIAVFGCGGDRDRGKRPLMGGAAEELADVVWVTSDNPRSEDPEAIIADILEGIADRARVRVVVDRAEAVAGAIEEAGPGDVVLIAGKGHETYQIVGAERRPFDDREVARRALAEGGGMSRATTGNRAGAAAPGVTGPAAIDTRELEPGSIFFALAGTRTDGHAFVPEALRRGAAAAVVREDWAAPPEVPAERLIRVEDPRQALLAFARARRNRLGARTIAVTGSVGKTTTKDLIRGLLAPRFRVTASARSFNNDLGVPLTILAAGEGCEVLVCEIGANAPGEIAELAAVARPEWAVITAVAEAHLDGFGDLDGVIRAKGEILDGLPAEGIAFLNRGARGFEAFARRAPCRIVEFGEGARHYAPEGLAWRGAGRALRTAGSPWLEVEIPGRCHVGNALAAIAVAREQGMDWEAIAGALRAFRPPPLRFRVEQRGGVVLIDDTYNANPASVCAAIEEVDGLACSGRRYVVLGDMRELGAASARLHAEVGDAVARSRFDELLAVGAEAARAAEAVERAGGRVAARFPRAEDVPRYLIPRLRPGDLVLLKGSRAVGLDAAARDLRQGLSCAAEGA